MPILFGFAGFAVDLGRMYLIRGELKAAANAMALAAAGKLIGTDLSIDSANTAARLVIDNSSGFGNKYNFGGLQIGQSTGFLNSELEEPSFFETLANATGTSDTGGTSASGGTAARYTGITVRAEAPLLFWSFLPLATERKTAIAAHAVAGISAPLCTACSIEVLAIAALDAEDTVHFGYTPNTKYTFGYQCTGSQVPQIIGDAVRVPYLLLNRLDSEAQVFADEQTQLYRIGAQGLPPSTDPAKACISINAEEQVWTNAGPPVCTGNVPPQVTAMLCGLATRFDSTVLDACASIPEIDSLLAYQPDTDLSDLDDYAGYTGAGRRVITVAVVDSLNSAAMVVQGFRQFLVEPIPESTNVNPSDPNGRFLALYIGNPVPLKAGRFDGCQITAGPGKVVLHQ